ncbi:DUF6236 family protein [Actinomadura sp. 1N219]|uniref:DUF6236 family protein n=1 Tax=Actinomadura sp. 1N219 TaxID=3375152 RepID=UPI0037ADBD78
MTLPPVTEGDSDGRQGWECSPAVLAPYNYARLENGKGGLSWTVGHSVTPTSYSGQVFLDFEPLLPSPSQSNAADSKHIEIVARLYRTLPAPASSVPIEKILEFREQRRPELLALRAAMDELGRSVTEAQNTVEALGRAKENLEQELIALHRVFNQAKIRKLASSAQIYLSLDDLAATKAIWPAIGTITAGTMHMPAAIGTLSGLAFNASLTFIKRRNEGVLQRIPKPTRDYAYAYFSGQL